VGPLFGYPAETNTVKDLLEAGTLSVTGKFILVGKAALPGAAQNLAKFGSLLVAQIGNQVSLLNSATDSGTPAFLVTVVPPGCLWFDLSRADGALDRGLWLPLGLYGVSGVAVPAAP